VPNHLVGESSPYLLQHAGNPVDWYPWGPEALARARDDDRPVFLSIGYSACHWCHVMEHESFTESQTAAFLNANFVSIKVDREERPDLDAIYMQAVTAMTGQGGWPLSVWLTPDGTPFYGGTYFPPSPRYGRPSFRQVLEALADLWSNHRDELHQTAARLLAHLGDEGGARGGTIEPHRQLAGATRDLRASLDKVNGGWGQAPKFPPPLALEYLMARQTESPQPEVQADIELTLDAMAAGGIYDHLGGGFHRYSTDESWLVPHFEKMLYDNTQLARCYLHGWQLTGSPRYREVAEETLDYLLGRMSHPRGGLFSAEDADSEGTEGTFYVWTPEQVRSVLTREEADLFETAYGVTARGNFEGTNVLHRVTSSDENTAMLARARARLLAARDQRVRPARDEKILAAWNGLALAALAEAARGLGSERYREAATRVGEFIASELIRPGSRLAHSWKDGRASGNGFLEDYACLVEGYLALYQTTFVENWFTTARGLADAIIEYFRRPAGGFYDTSSDHEALIVRPRSLQDSPTPSGNSMAATVLLKMAAYTGESGYSEIAEEIMAGAAELVDRSPVAFGQWLQAFHLVDAGLTELSVAGDLSTPQADDLLAVASSSFRPALVTAARTAGADTVVPMLRGRDPGPSATAVAWVCRHNTCAAPTSDPEELRALLDERP
jgi:uncharacterized protein